MLMPGLRLLKLHEPRACPMSGWLKVPIQFRFVAKNAPVSTFLSICFPQTLYFLRELQVPELGMGY